MKGLDKLLTNTINSNLELYKSVKTINIVITRLIKQIQKYNIERETLIKKDDVIRMIQVELDNIK